MLYCLALSKPLYHIQSNLIIAIFSLGLEYKNNSIWTCSYLSLRCIISLPFLYGTDSITCLSVSFLIKPF